MAIICYKPKGSCKNCNHYKFDIDYGNKCCFATSDAKFKIGQTVYYKDIELIIKSLFVSCDCISYVCVHKNEPQGNRYAFNEKILKGEN
jgi:hypothetical protein